MSTEFEYIAPCHFGLEAVLKREVSNLGYEITNVDNGKVTFKGGLDALVRANIFLRTTERILLKVGEFKAENFDELFDGTFNSTPWKKDRILVDPFCGSGTFPIEAAMIGMNMAPGMNREFTAENWDNIVARKYWYDAIDEANDLLDEDVEMDIQGYDIDGDAIEAAIYNAKEAGVFDKIHLQRRAVSDLSHRKEEAT